MNSGNAMLIFIQNRGSYYFNRPMYVHGSIIDYNSKGNYFHTKQSTLNIARQNTAFRGWRNKI